MTALVSSAIPYIIGCKEMGLKSRQLVSYLLTPPVRCSYGCQVV